MDSSAAAIPADPPSAPLTAFCGRCGAPLTDAPCGCNPQPPALNVLADNASVKSALGLYFTLLALCGAYRLACYFNDQPGVLYETVAAGAFAFIVILAAAPGWRKTLPALKQTGSARWLLLAPVGAIGTYLLATTLLGLINSFLGITSTGEVEGIREASEPGWWVPVLLTCAAPAIFEELAFRGCIQSSLSRVLAQRDALIITALLFAILHLSLFSLPHLLVMGLTLGVMRWRSGSLYPGMILHFCHNLLVVLHAQLGGPS
jgi:membrane protease YdiL (CAAX protease family)